MVTDSEAQSLVRVSFMFDDAHDLVRTSLRYDLPEPDQVNLLAMLLTIAAVIDVNHRPDVVEDTQGEEG
jgi:hypothetical protein